MRLSVINDSNNCSNNDINIVLLLYLNSNHLSLPKYDRGAAIIL